MSFLSAHNLYKQGRITLEGQDSHMLAVQRLYDMNNMCDDDLIDYTILYANHLDVN